MSHLNGFSRLSDVSFRTLSCKSKVIIDDKCNLKLNKAEFKTLRVKDMRVTGNVVLSEPLPVEQGGTGSTFGPVTNVPIQYSLFSYDNPQYRLILPGGLLGVIIGSCSLNEIIIPPSELLTQIFFDDNDVAIPVFTLNQNFLDSFPSLQTLQISTTSIIIPNNFGELDYNLVNDLSLSQSTPGPTTTGNFVFTTDFYIQLDLPGITSYGTFTASGLLNMDITGDSVTSCTIGSITSGSSLDININNIGQCTIGSITSGSNLNIYMYNLGPNSSLGNVSSIGYLQFQFVFSDGMTIGNFDCFGSSFDFQNNGIGTTPINVGYFDGHNQELFFNFSNTPVNTQNGTYPIHFGEFRNMNTGHISVNPVANGAQPSGGGVISFGNIINCVNIGLVIINMPTLTTIGSLLGSTFVNIPFQPAGILLYGNALTAAVVSQILIDLDANGQTNYSIDISGGTNAGFGALTVGGATAHANLLGKGWSINMNP